MSTAATRIPAGYFDGLYGRNMLRAIASITTEGGPDGECWVWQGAFSSRNGHPTYPALSMRYAGRRRQRLVHRVAYEAAYGPLAAGEQVHHRCATTACVRPEHLQAVSGRDNTAEMASRRALLARIATLEAVLRAYEPDHPALDDGAEGPPSE